MTEAWQSATEQSLRRRLDTDRAEIELLMPKELGRILSDIERTFRELETARSELHDVIADLVEDAFQSPYGEPSKPNDLGKRVQSEPAPQAHLIRHANADTAKFVNGRLLGITRGILSKTREAVGLVRDGRTACIAELNGLDPKDLAPRGPYRRRAG